MGLCGAEFVRAAAHAETNEVAVVNLLRGCDDKPFDMTVANSAFEVSIRGSPQSTRFDNSVTDVAA